MNDVSKQPQLPRNLKLLVTPPNDRSSWHGTHGSPGWFNSNSIQKSNSKKHMTAICDARLIHGRGGFDRYL